MDYYAAQRFLDAHGPAPSFVPEFIRLPPGHSLPELGPQPGFRRELAARAGSLGSGLSDHARMYQDYAKGLLSMSNPGLVPPGHPLYTRRRSLEIINAENARLQKENEELRRQLARAESPKDPGKRLIS